MKKRLLTAILSIGLLVGTTAPPAQAYRAHGRGGRGHGRRVGTGALGGAAVGGMLGRGRGALIGGALGAGAGSLHHRRQQRRNRFR